MSSSKLGRFVIVIIVVGILMAITVKYVFNGNDNWRNVSANGLQVKVQTGLTQIYWKWQSEGRAKQIEYQPGNVDKAFIINMTTKGLPVVERNEKGCKTFLSWFVEEKMLSKSLNVTTTFIERKLTNTNIPIGMNNDTSSVYICQFSHTKKIFNYDLITGSFTFTDQE